MNSTIKILVLEYSLLYFPCYAEIEKLRWSTQYSIFPVSTLKVPTENMNMSAGLSEKGLAWTVWWRGGRERRCAQDDDDKGDDDPVQEIMQGVNICPRISNDIIQTSGTVQRFHLSSRGQAIRRFGGSYCGRIWV